MTLRARFEIPLIVMLLSALIGVAVSFDVGAAWGRFWWIAGGLALAYGVAHAPERLGGRERGGPRPLALAFGLLPTATAAYFFLTNDWSYRMGKVEWLDPALRMMASWQPDLGIRGIDSNVAGGVIAAFLPLQAAALAVWGKSRGRGGEAARLALLGISALTLLLSESRGAWLALAVVAVGWGLVNARLIGGKDRGRGPGRSARDAADGRTADDADGESTSGPSRKAARTGARGRSAPLLGLAGLLVFGAALGALTPTGLTEQAMSQILGLRPDRLAVWQNSLDLAGDYALTGLGLSGFEMVYSSYALLIHVPHTYHAHNLFLDIHLQQGALGLIAFLWLVAAAAWPRSNEPALAAAARASLAVILLHGLLDDAFYGYGGQATPLLFAPLGALARGAEAAIATGRRGGAEKKGAQAPVGDNQGQPVKWGCEETEVDGGAGASGARRSRNKERGAISRSRVALLLAEIGALLALAFWLAPPTRAVAQGNLGAVVQTQAELSAYRWPEWSIQDQARRSSAIDLTSAIAWYEAALASDAGNATANRRLGQIELSLGRYEEARGHLEKAYDAAPNQRATRQMLGEAYAVAGEIERASEVWRSVEMDAGQMEARRGWYGEHLGDRERAERLRRAAAGLDE